MKGGGFTLALIAGSSPDGRDGGEWADGLQWWFGWFAQRAILMTGRDGVDSSMLHTRYWRLVGNRRGDEQKRDSNDRDGDGGELVSILDGRRSGRVSCQMRAIDSGQCLDSCTAARAAMRVGWARVAGARPGQNPQNAGDDEAAQSSFRRSNSRYGSCQSLPHHPTRPGLILRGHCPIANNMGK